eukprot:TRINITY_DN39035_c0_g1_i1.p1 TRINITY_DN39035_c0_g1~~TRINITY_DN39035_c0_g1_i1.p1  ORF type:complete len:278 (+),score=39.07 TRINITY_DN39035_c0_g1_i1:101-934(+)
MLSPLVLTSVTEVDGVTAATALRGHEVAGALPPLREQLAALTLEQMSARLEGFGREVRQPKSDEFVPGFRSKRQTELLDALCEAYKSMAAERPRIVVRSVGTALPEVASSELLAALRLMAWKENIRPGVCADGYVVLKRPKSSLVQPCWRETDPRVVRRRVWELAEASLRAVSPKASAFDFTSIAVSKNFHGSPHVDKNDLSPQYALSVGEFDVGGGELCIEEDPFTVRAFDTRGRLVCVDGRFPHWVSGYTGERYSIIFFRSVGEEELSTCAVHEV